MTFEKSTFFTICFFKSTVHLSYNNLSNVAELLKQRVAKSSVDSVNPGFRVYGK